MNSETRFHQLGKQTTKHSKPKETWFPVQTNQPAATLSSQKTSFFTTSRLRRKPGFGDLPETRFHQLGK
jgi:hypothetical protein